MDARRGSDSHAGGFELFAVSVLLLGVFCHPPKKQDLSESDRNYLPWPVHLFPTPK